MRRIIRQREAVARPLPLLVGLGILATPVPSGCATTASDGGDLQARIEMKTSPQPLVGTTQRAIPAIDESPPPHVEVATFGLG